MAGNLKSSAGTSPIQVTVDVGLEGGASVRGGSGKLIRDALDAVMAEISQKNYGVKINPVVDIKELQEKIQSQLKKGIKVDVGANVDIKDVKNSAKGSPADKSDIKSISKGDKGVSKPKASSSQNPDPEYEKIMQKSIKSAKSLIDKEISGIVKEGLKGAKNSVSGFDKAETDDKSNKINSILKTSDDLVTKLTKLSNTKGSNDRSGLDEKYNNAEFLTDRNQRVNYPEYLAPLKEAVDVFNKKISGVTNPEDSDSLSGAQDDNMNDIVLAFKELTEALNQNYKLNINPDKFIGTINSGSAVNPSVDTKDEPSAQIDGKSINAIVAALSKTKQQAVGKTTETAIGNIDKNIKQIADTLSKNIGKQSSASGKKSEASQSVNINPDSIDQLSKAISGIADKVSKENTNAKDYTEVLERIAQGVNSDKPKVVSEVAPPGSQTSEQLSQFVEALKGIDFQSIIGNINPNISAEFEANLTEYLGNAIYNAMLMATAEGGGIKEAISSALSAIPNSTISGDSIQAIADAVQNMNIPVPTINIPAPVVNITQNDYTDTLNRIADNTTPKDDTSSTILNEIPDKVASGITEAFKGIGVTQVNSGDDVKGVGRGLLSPEKTLEALLNDKVELTREKFNEKKRQLDAGMTEGGRAASNRRIKELDSQITGINNKARKYQNEEFYSALFARAEELNKRTKDEFDAAISFAKTQSNVYKSLQANEEKLYESRRQMIDNAVSGKKVGSKGFDTLQNRSDELREQIRKDNLANDSLGGELDNQTKAHIDSLTEYFVDQFKAVTEQIYGTRTDIGKAEYDKKGTKQNTEKLKSLEARRSTLKGIAGQLGIDSSELQSQLSEIDKLYEASYKNDVDKYKVQKEAEAAAKKEKEIAPKRTECYNRLKEEIKHQSKIYESLYKLYSLGEIDEANSGVLAELNNSEEKINSLKSQIRDKGYSNPGLDKEVSSLEANLEKDRKTLEKKYIDEVIKERVDLQEQLDKVTLKNMIADRSSEEYAANEIKKRNLSGRISTIDTQVIPAFNKQGDFNAEVGKLTENLTRLGKEYTSQEAHINSQITAYDNLKTAIENLSKAQAELDIAAGTGDAIAISDKQNAVNAARAAVEAQRQSIRDNNLTNKSLENNTSDFDRTKQFERLNNVTKEYYTAQAELIRMGADEAGKQSEKYKALENRIKQLGKTEKEVYDELNGDDTQQDGRFYRWQKEREILRNTVVLERNRATALQTINKWETKNRRAAEEYRNEIDNIVKGLNDAADVNSVGNLKKSFENIQAEATSRGLAGRDETKQELEANMATAKSLQQRYQDLLRKADIKAFKDYQQQIDSTKAAIEEAMGSGTKESLKDARRQLSELTSDFKSAGYAGGNLFTSLDKKVRGLFQLFLGGNVIGQIKQQFSDAYHSVVNLDNAFANIRMTMEASNAEMRQLAEESINLSKELGVSLESVTSAAMIYANQNISTKEIIERSKPTALLASAADMSSSAAADLIQGALYQFEMDDSVDNLNKIVDVVEKISASTGVEFKRSIEQISEGIQTTGAMAHEAGYSIEEYAAQVGSLVEKTRRSGSEVANGLKMIYARLGQNKEGDATEEEISKAEKAYKSIGINLRDEADSFRDLPDVFDELSQKWSDLSDVQRAYIAEVSAGNRNRSLFMAMMNSYDTTRSLTEDAMNSEGFAAEANEKRMDSFEAKLGKVKAAAAGFWNNLIDTGIIKTGLDILEKIISFADQLINKTAGLSQVIQTLFVFLAARTVPNFVKEISASDSAIGSLIRSVRQLIPNFKEFKEMVSNFKNLSGDSSVDEIAKAFEGAGSDETKTALAKYLGITDEQIEAAKNRLSEAVEEISSDTNTGSDEEDDSDGSGISDTFQETRERAEELVEAVEGVTQASEEAQEAQNQLVEAGENVASSLEGQTAATEALNVADTNQALSSEAVAGAEQAETSSRMAATAATTTETNTENLQTIAENEQTVATNANNASQAAGTAADVARTGSQLTLAKAIGIATKGLLAQAAAWAATPVGMITIATTAIAGLISINNSINESIENTKKEIEETQKAATNAVAEYRESTDSLITSEEKVVSLSNKYRKLSKGVSENGYRVSLTREEYEEYKSVVAEIAELAPHLVDGYNSENTALLNLGDTIDETREKYRELNKERAREFVEEKQDVILAANRDVFDDDSNLTGGEDKEKQIEYMKSWAAAAEVSWFSEDNYYLNRWKESHTDKNIIRAGFTEALGEIPVTATMDSIEKVRKWVEKEEAKMQGVRDSVNQLVLSEMQTEDEFYNLSTFQKEMIDSMLNSILNSPTGYGIYRKIADGELSISYVSAQLLKMVSDKGTSNLLDAKAELDRQYNEGIITISEYKKKMGVLYEEAKKAAGGAEFGDILYSQFSTDDAEKSRREAISGLGDSAIDIANILDSKEYEHRYDAQKALETLLDDFTVDDINVLARLDIDPEWDEEDLKKELKNEKFRMREYAKDNFNFLDSSYKSDIDTFTNKISKLKSAMKSSESLSSEDLLELMMEFNSFDWASFGVTGEAGVGNVKGAIKTLIDQSFVELKEAFGAVDDKQIKVFANMANEAKKATGKINSLSDAVDKVSSSYSTLKKVQEESAKYGRLDIDTVAELIEKYPELSTPGALYITGQISLDEFMSEFKKSYDAAYEESAKYIYQKALEDDNTMQKYVDYVSSKNGKKTAESLAEKEAEKERAKIWEEISSVYELDLDEYMSWEEAKEAVNKKMISNLKKVSKEYEKYINFEDYSVDAEKMSKDGYSLIEILNFGANVEYAKRMRNEIEAYYSGTTVFTANYINKIGELYDIDLSNCRSYFSAKKKILARLYAINEKYFTVSEDDGSGILVTMDMINDLIDMETGAFDGKKALEVYHIGGEAFSALEKMAAQIKEISDIGKSDIDFSFMSDFFGELNLEDVADAAEKLNNILSDMISLYDDVFDGIQAVADKRIETLEKEKDALEDKNEEEKQEIELIKARQQLEDAKRNKNIRVYYEGKGFVWETDSKAIAEAEDNLREKELEAKTGDIDKQIDATNEYVDYITGIPGEIEDEKNISVAMRQFGVSSPDKLLELSPDTIKALGDNYRSLSLENDKQENSDKLSTYSTMTDEQIKERFGSNFGIPIDSLRNYWSGTYFIPDTIKQYQDTEKKSIQVLASKQPVSPASENKNYYIENLNITYSGDSIEELLKSAVRISKSS